MLKHATVAAALAFSAASLGTLSGPAAAAIAAKKKATSTKKKAARRPVDATTSGASAKPQREGAAEFSWTARPADVDMDARADAKRDEAVAKLKRIMPSIANGPQKAELIFRLSEMYWAKSRFLHMRAMQAWDQALQRWHEGGAAGKQPTVESTPEYSKAHLFKRETLGLYERILAEYPRYARKDEVLYNLGSALYDAGKKKKGVGKYWTLIKQYPSSEFAPDAWLQLGEHFFNANKLTSAVKSYSKAAETKKPRIYSYALYKLAWCDYNLQEYENALSKFRQVVDYAKKQQGTARVAGAMAETDRVQLVEEALSDMVRTYSHLDAVEDAFAYYTNQVGKARAYDYLHRLGGLYDSEGKYALEIKIYKELNVRYPYAERAPQNQTAVMAAFAQLGKRDEVRREARRLIELYAPNGVWAKKNAGNEAVLSRAFEVVEQQLAAVVTEQHRAAQETKLVATYRLARDLYKEYLGKFTDTLNSYAFRFYYAEILYELKEFDVAAQQYTQVVSMKPEGKFAKHAAYTTILAWEKVLSGVKETLGKRIHEGRRGKSRGALKKLEQIRMLKKGESYEQTELTAVERRLADACDRFVDVAPKDDEVVKVKFKSARLYYIHNQFEEAAKRFGEIIERWPTDALARIGAESIVQSFNVRKDWSQLNAWSRKFRHNARLMSDAKFKRTINEFVEGASFNEIHFVIEPKRNLINTADRYSAFAGEFPQSKYVLVALYNALVNYDKANLLHKAMAKADTVLGRYRRFKISKAEIDKSKKDGAQLPDPAVIREKVMFLSASFYERLAMFDQSAKLYEQYLAEFKDGPKRADAVFNAALYREGLGDHFAAIHNYQVYVKEFPTKEDVPDIAWRIGTILERKGDHRGTQAHFEAWARTYGKADPARRLCAALKTVEALEAQGRHTDARKRLTALIAGYENLEGKDREDPCALDAVARAAFEQIEPDFEAYMAIELTGSEKTVAANLTKKLSEVDALQKRFTEVLGLGQGDYGIASLYRVGQMYRDLAEKMFASPCPRHLNDDQCGMYQAALQEKAFPLEEKSIEAFDKALDKAYELGLYNEWLAKTQEALRTYEPGRFPEVHEYDLVASETVSEVPDILEAYR